MRKTRPGRRRTASRLRGRSGLAGARVEAGSGERRGQARRLGLAEGRGDGPGREAGYRHRALRAAARSIAATSAIESEGSCAPGGSQIEAREAAASAAGSAGILLPSKCSPSIMASSGAAGRLSVMGSAAFEVRFEGARLDAANDAPEHRLGLRMTARWRAGGV